MEEIAPGIHHWSAVHPDIHIRVSSYYVEAAGIVIDPIEPEDGYGFFDSLDLAPQQAVLTSALHWRHSDRFRDRYDLTVRAPEPGLHRYDGTDREAEPYSDGDDVAPGVRAVQIGGIAPDDFALHIQHGGGAFSLADALTHQSGVLAYVPDSLMDDPEDTRHALTDALRGLLTRDFDTLLFAHGQPLAKGAHAALKDFVK
jgi:hypothetical protein